MDDAVQGALLLIDLLVVSKYVDTKRLDLLGLAAHHLKETPSAVPSELLLKKLNGNKLVKNKIELLSSNSYVTSTSTLNISPLAFVVLNI